MRHLIPAALDFRKWLGGEVKINGYCRDLAIRGGQKLAEILETEEMDQTPNRELTLNMVRSLLPRVRGVFRLMIRSM
jgi:hercynylcysteine S-oxide lyase